MMFLATVLLLILAARSQDTSTLITTTTLLPSATIGTSSTTPTRTFTSLPLPSSTTPSYQRCDNWGVIPQIPCPTNHKCIGDPRRDTGSICVPVNSPQCGGLRGAICPLVTPGPAFGCYDYPEDSCDTRKGGRDCTGICLKPLNPGERPPVPPRRFLPVRPNNGGHFSGERRDLGLR
jgi:hypothetical protein